MQVVWFKRDLRVHDNEALFAAAQAGKVLPLYIVEPDLWQQPDMSQRHYAFLRECLIELFYELRKLGQALVIKIGDPVKILQSLHEQHHIDALWSHQETWNGWTYARDLRVKNWTKKANITWHEPLQFGVFRRLKSRDNWSKQWGALMSELPFSPPDLCEVIEPSEKFPTDGALGFIEDTCTYRQIGGRKAGA